MNSPCAIFRAELEEALAGPAGRFEALAAHAHARACASCRAELLRERALEACLERDPEPELPAGLAPRTLARLAEARRDAREETRLDRLLERDAPPTPPVGLPRRILRRLGPVRSAPVPSSPVSTAPARRPRGRLVAAAALLLALGLWGWRALRPEPGPAPEPRVTEVPADEEAELLAYALDNWELLQDDDLDLWLASLDPLDQVVLEYADGDLWNEAGGLEEPSGAGPSDGAAR